jgi:hypothetical protein
MQIELGLYDALVAAGTPADKAHESEKMLIRGVQLMLVAAIDSSEQGHMTKQDGHKLDLKISDVEKRLELKISDMQASILKAMNDQTWKLVTFVVASNAAMLAIVKHFG